MLTFFLLSVIPKKSFASRGALSFVEYVAVWALKLPVLHTDVLKTHSSQSFSTELLEFKESANEHLARKLQMGYQ